MPQQNLHAENFVQSLGTFCGSHPTLHWVVQANNWWKNTFAFMNSNEVVDLRFPGLVSATPGMLTAAAPMHAIFQKKTIKPSPTCHEN